MQHGGGYPVEGDGGFPSELDDKRIKHKQRAGANCFPVCASPLCLSLIHIFALVNVGGLLASTVLSLLMLPVYYTLMNRKRKPQLDVD